MKKTQNNFGFTLVELIVVITILAILGTIAFISLQGYSAQARDSKRLSDIANIKKSLELFSLNTGKYPEPDDYFTVSYGSQILRYQGTVGDQVSINLSRNLNEKPTDPLTESEYTYSRTYAGTEYELLSIYESDLMSFNSLMPFVALAKKGYNSILLNQTNAANQNYPKINGNYNGVYVKAGIYYLPTPSIINGNIWGNVDLATETTLLESQVITGGDNVPGVSTGGLDGMSVEIFSGTLDTDKGQDEGGNKALLAQALISAYSGTILASGGVYKEIVETESGDYVSLVDNFVLNSDNFVNSSSSNDEGGEIEEGIITSTDCSDAGWIWVDSDDDVYIGSTRGNGFCISPRFGDWGDTNDGTDGISWNGWGNYYTFSFYRGWDASNVDDDINGAPQYGQTRKLDSYISYDCIEVGTATSDYDTSDTIVGRMKWLATVGNDHSEARSISWIVQNGTSNVFVASDTHPIPALYIADCIDGVKDLTTDMTYIHKDNSSDEILYELEYNDNETVTGGDYVIYHNRQKYLTAWTQKSGSHLPSAFSYIDDGTKGGEYFDETDGWDKYTNDEAKGEYQVACEAGKFGTYSEVNQSSTNDQEAEEWIWLSSIGAPTGASWERGGRIIGTNGCSDQEQYYAGSRSGTNSARFVVRP